MLSIDYPRLLQDLASTPVDIQGLILDLIQERSSSGRSDIPIIFIGHSFGGTLLKQLYIATHPSNSTREEYHSLYHLIRGYVYLGTPHKDLYVDDVSKLWRAIAAKSQIASNSTMLQQALSSSSRINHEFRRLGGEDVPSLCFYETVKTYVGLQQRFIVSKEEASIPSQSELIPIERRHQELGLFRDENDTNFVRFLGPFQKLMSIAQEPVLRAQGVAAHKLRLLSLDGGGVKGLFSILVLDRLMDEVQKIEGTTSTRKRPCDYFDLIGGTSTGGLLAIMLGRLEMDTKDCIRTYRSLAQTIFGRSPWLDLLQPLPSITSALFNIPWYSGEKLQQCIRQTVHDNLPTPEKQHLTSQGLPLQDALLIPHSHPTPSRIFVCAVPSGAHKTQRLRSYRSLNPTAPNTSSYTIWQAARATSAAPMYFPRTHIGSQTFFDGGLDSNNPVIETIEEARDEFPNSQIETLVSIGTGMAARAPDPHGALDVVRHFIHRATNTEAQHRRVLSEAAFRDVVPGYFRLQGEAELGAIDLAGYDRLDEIERLAEAYLRSEEGLQMVGNCAARLARGGGG